MRAITQAGFVRLIPAHAGKTGRYLRRRDPTTAHPRSRGENTSRSRSRALRWGSSPLTRGKQIDVTVPAMTSRLIPAHAGKTCARIRRPTRARAHPRSRGENLFIKSGSGANSGSSPLTRGKPGAYMPILTPVPAHPRSRGENVKLTRK